MTAAKLNLHTIFLAAEISLQQIKMQRSRETLRLPRAARVETMIDTRAMREIILGRVDLGAVQSAALAKKMAEWVAAEQRVRDRLAMEETVGMDAVLSPPSNGEWPSPMADVPMALNSSQGLPPVTAASTRLACPLGAPPSPAGSYPTRTSSVTGMRAMATEMATSHQSSLWTDQGLVTEFNGLKLHVSSKGNKTKYTGVTEVPRTHKKYQARHGLRSLGYYTTTLQAAIAYARYRQGATQYPIKITRGKATRPLAPQAIYVHHSDGTDVP